MTPWPQLLGRSRRSQSTSVCDPELIDRTCLVGTASELQNRVDELEDAGLDQIILLPPLDEKEAVITDVAQALLSSSRYGSAIACRRNVASLRAHSTLVLLDGGPRNFGFSLGLVVRSSWACAVGCLSPRRVSAYVGWSLGTVIVATSFVVVVLWIPWYISHGSIAQ